VIGTPTGVRMWDDVGAGRQQLSSKRKKKEPKKKENREDPSLILFFSFSSRDENEKRPRKNREEIRERDGTLRLRSLMTLLVSGWEEFNLINLRYFRCLTFTYVVLPLLTLYSVYSVIFRYLRYSSIFPLLSTLFWNYWGGIVFANCNLGTNPLVTFPFAKSHQVIKLSLPQ